MQPLYKDSAYEVQAKQLSKQQQIQRQQQRKSLPFEAPVEKQSEGSLEKRHSGSQVRNVDRREFRSDQQKVVPARNSDVESTISFKEEEELNEEDIHLMEVGVSCCPFSYKVFTSCVLECYRPHIISGSW